MRYLGDLAEDQVIDFKFSTFDADGVLTSLLGTPVVKVYKDNATATETAVGVTLTVDFDGVTGLNHVRIDTSADAFYATASDYSVVITAGTVDGISVAGMEVAAFSIENRFIEADVVKWLGAAPLSLSSQQVRAIVPDTQKVDVETIKGQAVNDPGGIVTIPTTIAGGNIDGITYDSLLTTILATLSGVAAVTNNGDGTHSIAFKKRDGTTTQITVTVQDTYPGVRTISTIA